MPMNPIIRKSQAFALIGLPLMWLLMSALHFRSIADFLRFRPRYIPVPAVDQVTRLIQAHNRWPLLHDPHMLGYLSLPALALVAFGLYAVGRRLRPGTAALGISLTISGTVFLGGVFGLFTSLFRGLGDVDMRYIDGAIATYAAVTADDGAYGLTRALAQLAMLGIAVQAGALWRAPGVPVRSPLLVAAGCALLLAFWDVDNVTFVASLLLLAGFVPIARQLRRLEDGASTATRSAADTSA